MKNVGNDETIVAFWAEEVYARLPGDRERAFRVIFISIIEFSVTHVKMRTGRKRKEKERFLISK